MLGNIRTLKTITPADAITLIGLHLHRVNYDTIESYRDDLTSAGIIDVEPTTGQRYHPTDLTLTDGKLYRIEIPVTAEEQHTTIETQRKARYRDETDPLFFGWQRGENTEQAWLDAVSQIKTELPY